MVRRQLKRRKRRTNDAADAEAICEAVIRGKHAMFISFCICMIYAWVW
jgi:transposase